MRPLLLPPPPPPRICRNGVFLPYRGVSPLVWKTIRLINDDRLKEK